MNAVVHHDVPRWVKVVGMVTGVAVFFLTYAGLGIWFFSGITTQLSAGQAQLNDSVKDLTRQMRDSVEKTGELTVTITSLNTHMKDVDRRLNSIEQDEKDRSLQEWRKK